ncbi:MAG TPA: extracellular solute-binding protein [Actinocatenispora sp.]
MIRLNRRQFFAGASAAAGIAALAGCADTDGLRATFYEGSAGVNQTLLRFFRRLAAGSPELAVRPQYGPFNGYFDKLAVSFAGGSAPDVVMVDPTHLADYAKRGALRTLADAVPRRIDPARCRPDVLSGGSVGGTLYGVPDGQHTQALLIDTDAAGRLAPPPDAADLTWAEYGRWAAEVHRASGGRRYGTEDAGGLDYAFAIWVRQRGRQLFDADGRLAFDRADLADWLAYWQGLRRSGGAVPTEVSLGESARQLVTGTAVAGFNYSNMRGVASQVKTTLAMRPMPLGRPGERPAAYQYLEPTTMLCVNRRSRYAERAVRIAAALVSAPTAAGELGTVLGSPPSTSVFTRVRTTARGLDRTILDYDAMVLREGTASPYPASRPAGAYQLLSGKTCLLNRANDSVGYGLVTPADAAVDFMRQATSILQT